MPKMCYNKEKVECLMTATYTYSNYKFSLSRIGEDYALSLIHI